MKVRPLIARDRGKIARLLRQSGTFNEKEVQVALGVIDEVLRAPKKGDYQIFCALNGNSDLGGYICFGPVPMTEGCYDLYWIAVDKRFSRKGVGGELLRLMEEFVISEGGRRIYVDTSSTPPYEPARSFYQKRGYQVACLLSDFYRDRDHKIIFMKEVRSIVPEKAKVSRIRKGALGHQQQIFRASGTMSSLS